MDCSKNDIPVDGAVMVAVSEAFAVAGSLSLSPSQLVESYSDFLVPLDLLFFFSVVSSASESF